MINEAQLDFAQWPKSDMGSQEHWEEKQEETQNVLRPVGLLEIVVLEKMSQPSRGLPVMERLATHLLTKNKPTFC